MKKVILAISVFAVVFATTALTGCANEAAAPIEGEVKTAPQGAGDNTTKPKPPTADPNQ